MRALLIACSLLLAAAAPGSLAAPSAPPSASEPLPDPALRSFSGAPVRLSDFRGKWTVLALWAPWCPRCKAHFPDLNDLDALPGVAVLGLAADYGIDPQSALDVAARYRLRFPNALGGSLRDPSSPARALLPEASFVPVTVLYAPDGSRAGFWPGYVSKRAILERIGRAKSSAPAR